MTDMRRLVDEYLCWLRKELAFVDLGNAFEITTPFLDRHNDHLQIYVRQCDDKIILSDDGSMIGDLKQSGCNLETEHRRRLLTSILNGFGVQRVGDELQAVAHNGDFPHRKHALVQAMLAVGDLFATAQPHVKSLFLEDVALYLDQINAHAFPNFQLVGKSGLQHKFDFALPQSHKAPERLLRAINRPNRDAALLTIAAWNDVRSSRAADAEMYAILNNTTAKVSGEIIDAMRQYDIRPMLWTDRLAYKDRLAA